MLVDNRGKVHAELTPLNSSGNENQPMVQKEQAKDVAEGCPRCLELEEALRKASKISTAEQLAEGKIKVTISKDRYKEVISAMQESSDFFYIIIDSINRIFVRAGVDLRRHHCRLIYSLEIPKMYYLKGMKVYQLLNRYK